MSLPEEPLSRVEKYLSRIAGESGELPEPLSRIELYLAAMAGENVILPDEPLSRIEQYLEYIVENGGGGGDITLETLNVSENGTTNAPSGKAYNKVVTNVQPTGTKQVSISQNGTTTENVADYASAEISVNVPNSYAAGDEGKVVSNGALAAQSSGSTTQNGTVDTTLINSLSVNVPQPSGTLPITDNGTYDVTQYAAAEVNVQTGGGGFPELDYIGFNASGATIDDDVVFDFGNAVANLQDFLRNTKFSNEGITVEVKCGSITSLYRGLSAYGVNTNLYTVVFSPETKYTESSSWSEFTRASKAARILGKPLLTHDFGTGNNKIFNSGNLVECYIAPNQVVSGGAGIATGELVDASIVSIANGLQGGLATAQTLTISNAATKAKCSTIVGTVSQVTEDGMTFDFFTQDASGTVTLADFITNTKGWTLA